jgi:hypothetical protein
MRLPYHENDDAQGAFECDCCGETFWIKVHTIVSWEVFSTEEDYDNS